MAHTTASDVREKVIDELDDLADRATGLAGSAAGMVVDPRTGLRKAKTAALRPTAILLAIVVVLTAVLVLRRRSGRS